MAEVIGETKIQNRMNFLYLVEILLVYKNAAPKIIKTISVKYNIPIPQIYCLPSSVGPLTNKKSGEKWFKKWLIKERPFSKVAEWKILTVGLLSPWALSSNTYSSGRLLPKIWVFATY